MASLPFGNFITFINTNGSRVPAVGVACCARLHNATQNAMSESPVSTGNQLRDAHESGG